jgi:hypothetical protein
MGRILYTGIHNSLAHYKKIGHLNGAEVGNMRHTDRKRNSPRCLYGPRVLSYVDGRQGCRLSGNGDAISESILRA